MELKYRIYHGKDNLNYMLLSVNRKILLHYFEQLAVNENGHLNEEFLLNFSGSSVGPSIQFVAVAAWKVCCS